MKRLLSIVLALSMMLGIVNISYAEEVEDPLAGLKATEAKIVFTKDGAVYSDNITKLGYIGPIQYVNGEYVLYRDHSIEDGRHIQVVTDNDWLYAPKGTTVEIDIEYIDKGNGFLAIRYNGLNDIKWWEGFTELWSETEKLIMTDTGKLKKYTFYMDDVKAMQEFSGKDFEFSMWTHQYGVSPGDMYIKSITIRKVFPKDPLVVDTTSEIVGNNFGPDEDKVIRAKFSNITEYAFKTEASYKICDYDGNKLTGTVLGEGTFEFENEPYGENEFVFDVNNLTKFGVYRIYIDFKHTGEFEGEPIVATSSTPIGFSIINKAEWHERNPVVNINGHSDKGIGANAKLAAYAGFGHVREGVCWFETDLNATGDYIIPESHLQAFEQEEKNNLGRLFLATYGPWGYIDHEPFEVYHLPTSEKAHKAYADYINFVLDSEPGIDIVSMWNEPTHYGFEINPPEVYAQMIKTAYPLVKAKHPDIPLVGAGTAQVDVEFIERILAAGAGDYMDAVSFHPYDWSGGTYNLSMLEGAVQTVNDLFIKHTGKKKPIVIDEMGMHTGGSLDGRPDSTAKYAEDEQGASYIKIFAAGRTQDWFEQIYYYDLVDDGNDDNYAEHRFGLTKSSFEIPSVRYSAKPGYVQLAGLNKFMWDAEGIECVKPEEGIWLCNFKKPSGENIAIVWTEVGSECSIDFNLGTNEIEVFDMYTNSIGKMTSGDGVHTIGLTRHPLYIKGNFTNFTAEKSSEGMEMDYIATPDDTFEMTYSTNDAGVLRAECDAPGRVLVSEMNGSNIHCETTSDAIGSGYATVKIYNGDDLVYIAQPQINVEDAFIMAVESQQVSERDSNHWHMKTTILNSSNTKPISGYCRIIEMNGQKVEGKGETFENLKPKEQISLYLNLHEMVKKRNVNLKIEVALTNGYSKIEEKELDFTAAKYASKKPVIDGKFERGEWNGVWLTADTEDRTYFENGTWNGKDDISVDVNLMWDEKYLYFGAIATDDTHFNDRGPSELWAGDSIQFGVENRVYKGDYRIGMGGTGGTNYTEVGIGLLNNTEPAVYRWLTQDTANPVGEIPNCNLEIKRVGNKTYYELAIPWTELISQDYVLEEDTLFGFSMLINENDGSGREGWLEYNSGIGINKNTIRFGKMKLIRQ